LTDRRREVGLEVLGGPGRAARAGDRPGADEQHVGGGPEQRHHEAIGLEEAADHAAAGLLARAEGDHPVDGRDEVDDQRRPVRVNGDLERPAILRLERLRHRPASARSWLGRERGRGPQELERRHR
jgi:hypothetical protein